jgi:hypothetical protein
LKKSLLFPKSYYLTLGLLTLLAKLVLLFKDPLGLVLAGGQLADTIITEALFAALLGRREDTGHTKGKAGGIGPHGQNAGGKQKVSPLMTTYGTGH